MLWLKLSKRHPAIKDNPAFLKNLRRFPQFYAAMRFVLNPGLRLYCLKRNRILRDLEEGELVLNIGSGAVKLKGRVVTLDVDLELPVDVAADARYLPFKDASFGAVLMESLLEHVREPEAVIGEALRVLKRGGKVFVEMPFMYPYHDAPSDFRRYTLSGLEEALRQFRKLESGTDVGPAGTFCAALRGLIATAFSFNSPLLYRVLFLVTGFLTFPVKFLDLLLVANRESHQAASVLFYIGEKP